MFYLVTDGDRNPIPLGNNTKAPKVYSRIPHVLSGITQSVNILNVYSPQDWLSMPPEWYAFDDIVHAEAMYRSHHFFGASYKYEAVVNRIQQNFGQGNGLLACNGKYYAKIDGVSYRTVDKQYAAFLLFNGKKNKILEIDVVNSVIEDITGSVFVSIVPSLEQN